MAIVPYEPVTAKFISANCNFLPFSSNPPNIIPANISDYIAIQYKVLPYLVIYHFVLKLEANSLM